MRYMVTAFNDSEKPRVFSIWISVKVAYPTPPFRLDVYRDENNDYKRRFVGYKFTHALKVDFSSDNELLGKTLYKMSQSDLAPEFRISYTVADPEAVKNELIGKAVKDAMKKAEVLAKAAGLTLGSIQTVDYSWGKIDMEVRPMDNMLMSPCAGPCEMDIEPDDIEIGEAEGHYRQEIRPVL